MTLLVSSVFFFFFNDTATTEIYTSFPTRRSSDLKGVLSSRWLMPNDYLRLKNLTLGFSAPKEWISNLGLSKARVYFSANNLLTWKSKDLYVDPETPADGLCTFEMPALRTYTFGIELSF